MSQNRNKKGKRNNGQRKPIQKQTVMSDLSMVKVSPNPRRMRNTITPEYKLSSLHFNSDLLNFTPATNSYGSKVFKINDLYDPDPSLLTSSIAGFAELARYYYYHLVVKVRVQIIVSNREAFPAKVYCGVFNEDPSPSLSSAQAVIDLAENPMVTAVREVSAQGGQDKTTLSLTANLANVVGDVAYFYGSGYYTTYYNNSPSTNLILCIGTYAGSNFTSAGFGLSISFRYTVKSYCRRPILDSGPVSMSMDLNRVESKIDVLLKEMGADVEEIMPLINLIHSSRLSEDRTLRENKKKTFK